LLIHSLRWVKLRFSHLEGAFSQFQFLGILRPTPKVTTRLYFEHQFAVMQFPLEYLSESLCCAFS
jgi:hypothetical protein